MSDIKKALDAYKKTSASGNGSSNSNTGSAGNNEKAKTDSGKAPPPEKTIQIKKYVFSTFSAEKANVSPNIKESEIFNVKEDIATEQERFLKLSKLPEEERKDTEAKTASDKDVKKYEKAAKVLLLLGKEEAASVLKHFKPDEIEKIASSLIKIKTIDKEEAAALLKELKKNAFIKETFSGGVERARQMLCTAFGKEKGEQLLYKALPEAREKPFEFMQDLETHQIKLALKDESMQVISIVMNYLDPKKSAALLQEYTKEEQKNILLCIASGGKIQREVFEQMEKIIKEKVRLQGNVITQRIDGRSKLANILKFMDIKNEENIIKNISEFDPELSKEIEEQVYTIDIVLKISNKDLYKIFNRFSDKEVAVILKGQEPEIKNKILSSFSQTRQELVHNESEYIGIMRKSEVNIAVREFVDYIKQAEKDGEITIEPRQTHEQILE